MKPAKARQSINPSFPPSLPSGPPSPSPSVAVAAATPGDPPAGGVVEPWERPVEVGSKVWLRCEDGYWFPGKVIPFKNIQEPKKLSRCASALNVAE